MWKNILLPLCLFGLLSDAYGQASAKVRKLGRAQGKLFCNCEGTRQVRTLVDSIAANPDKKQELRPSLEAAMSEMMKCADPISKKLMKLTDDELQDVSNYTVDYMQFNCPELLPKEQRY